MQYLKHCLNPTVLAALVVVAAAIWAVAPGALGAAWPVLVVAVCPLSMLAMMLLMRDSRTDTGPGELTAEAAQHASGPSGDADGAQIAALRAQAADLQARLAAAAPPRERADDAAGPTSDASARR
ncbi:MAG: DUF2933 domain-containing protein [Actinobacteria bacterium]|nr:DUF2933 domain-containing protein [Actinomycetota bacterium]